MQGNNGDLNSDKRCLSKSKARVRSNTLAIYTTLFILMSMKDQLGLEPMLEYIEQYIIAIDLANPEVRCAVSKAMSVVNIEKMYRDAVNDKEINSI